MHIDELEEEIASLIDVLSDHGQGAKVKQFFEDQMRPIVEVAAEDDAEKTFYSAVTKMLDAVRPVERTYGSVSERGLFKRRREEADNGEEGEEEDGEEEGEEGEEEDEPVDEEVELNDVDVLDADAPLMENDRVPDAANIFEDATDKRTWSCPCQAMRSVRVSATSSCSRRSPINRYNCPSRSASTGQGMWESARTLLSATNPHGNRVVRPGSASSAGAQTRTSDATATSARAAANGTRRGPSFSPQEKILR